MPISASSVLWGIVEPVCIIRTPHDLTTAETVTLANRNHPPRFRFELEAPAGQTPARARSGRLRETDDRCRIYIAYQIDELTADETKAWAKLWNYYMAGYQLIMIPHNDAALKLEWRVKPNTGFNPGFLGDRYLGHSLNCEFISIDLHAHIPLLSSLNEFNRVVY